MAEPVYVISGWMRSGTSMMMKALEAGGMEAVYRASRDEMKARYADEHYDPNIGGLYELERADYQRPDFPAGYEGKLIKALRMGPARMQPMPGGIKVVFMRRDPEEQRQSYMAFFGADPPPVQAIMRQVERSLTAIKARDDIDLMELEYTDVLASPYEAFRRVGLFFGVGLNLTAAAEVVDPQYYRFRREELTIGII